ncbi:AarF/ABC1/UbiB kinase family protein [Alkalicella caledoniensis]|uniref:AarF/ABC1/UbiB kinase family protein n=1 Tax=Alkalicella caledoniensis TaxID=2731377 RepID=A0A7G9W501_ALKCA|nr:lipopolysaccharide core heptose(II) kinase RfaY [Alkalicella caledoniensis]QNO13763.1 AarF/ABC1/UbiB kinase family protein [Alkalicella caledoniensis]
MKVKNKRQRFREIVSVLLKYGFKEGINSPEQMRKALEELGPTFIKIGQILSTRPDILPDKFTREFEKLQDEVSPVSIEIIEKIIIDELGGPLSHHFQFFSEKPIASASMAQVHKATLKSGASVVVKIRRPNIESIMLNDLALLSKVTRFIKFIPQGSILNPQEMFAELYHAVKEELDFINEAENIKTFSALNKDVRFLKIPKLYPEYVTKELLVMEYIDGFKISDKYNLLNAGYDLNDIANKLVHNFLKQVFNDGIFHGDPHPGNIYISKNKIAYLDLGLVGKLSPQLKTKFNQLLFAVVTGDIEAITHTILRMGVKKGPVNRMVLQSDIEDIYNYYVSASMYDIDIPELVDRLFAVCRAHKISVPKEITLILKSFLLMEGNLATLAPEITIMDIATPYVREEILKSKDVKGEFLKSAESIYRFTKATMKIPEKMLSVLSKFSSGTIQVHMDHTNLDNNVNKITKAADRIVIGLILAALVIGSSEVISSHTGPTFYDISILGLVGYILAALLALFLVISIMRSGRL